MTRPVSDHTGVSYCGTVSECPVCAIKRRHFADAEESPEAITVNAIAADAMAMRVAVPKWTDATKGELAGALAVGVDLVLRELSPQHAPTNTQPLDADTLERELVRIAALCVRLIERR